MTGKEVSYVLSFVGMKKRKGAAQSRAMIIRDGKMVNSDSQLAGQNSLISKLQAYYGGASRGISIV